MIEALRRHWPVSGLLVAIVVASGVIIYVGRGQTPISDEWAYYYYYEGWALKSLLYPHNGHLVVLPVLLYKALYELFGIESHLPFQLVNMAFSAAIASVLFTLVRRSVGDFLALAAAVLVLFYGAGAEALVPTAEYTNMLGMSTGLGMLLLLRREDLRGDVFASILLAASLASFSIGVAFACGAALMIGMRGPGNRVSRAWVVLIPVAFYGAWVIWAQQFDQSTIYVHNLKVLGSAFADQLSAALSGITGLFTIPNAPPENLTPIRTTYGPVLIAGVAVMLGLRLRRPPRPTSSALAATTVLVVYCLLVGIALNQFRNTFDPRLVYLASILTLLAVAEMLGPYRPSRAVVAVVGVALVFSLCANIAELSDGGRGVREVSAQNRAKLAAVDLVGSRAPEDLMIEEPPMAMTMTVGQMAQLDREHGSVAYSEPELASASPPAREAADEEFVRLLQIAPRPVDRISAAGQSIGEVEAIKGVARVQGSCFTMRPDPDARMEAGFDIPPRGFSYRSRGPFQVVVGRFGDAPTVELQPRSGANRVEIPADDSGVPWRALVKATSPAIVCAT